MDAKDTGQHGDHLSRFMTEKMIDQLLGGIPGKFVHYEIGIYRRRILLHTDFTTWS
jgi:hypothetical protein